MIELPIIFFSRVCWLRYSHRPLFLIIYLNRVKNHLREPAVLDTLGHIYEHYSDDYFYWVN